MKPTASPSASLFEPSALSPQPSAITTLCPLPVTLCPGSPTADAGLEIDHPHAALRVTKPRSDTARSDGVDARKIIGREADVHGAHIFLEVSHALGAGNRHDVSPTREEPRQSELRGRAPFLSRELLDVIHEIEVLLEVLTLEAR